MFDTASQPAERPTVFIVEDDRAVGEALCDLLDSAGLPARCFCSAEQFLAQWKPEMAGCLVLDVRLPGMNGMELQARLRKDHIEIPVIVMSAHGDVAMVRRVFHAGAVEFLSKPFQDEELLKAVRQAFAQDRQMREERRVADSIRARIASLSDRERQVIGMVTDGLTNREIAERLFLSVVTVKLYRRLAMEKMRAESLAELVKMWQKQ